MTPAPWFRALALDYDGTLTANGAPEPYVLERLAQWRYSGGRVLLVTGRILSELLVAFPDVGDHVDLVVAENGAVLWDGERSRLLNRPVEASLSEVLHARGIPCRRGSVILASHGTYVPAIEAAIYDLGLDVQLVANRDELMVLPAGISKGTGVRAGLRALGMSPHSAVAIGDGENDQSLLRSCELGVAVANAVPSLRRVADIITDAPDARGVVELLDGPFIRGGARLPSVEHIVALLQQHLGTVVVDLSLQPDAVRQHFYRRAPAVLELLRAARGVPHWILLDEAHTSLLRDGAVRSSFDANRKGHLLVTFEPGRLPASVVDQIDVAIIIPGSDDVGAILVLQSLQFCLQRFRACDSKWDFGKTTHGSTLKNIPDLTKSRADRYACSAINRCSDCKS